MSNTSPRRSLLFTPANRPALYPKALASGADMICIDLEDAVAPDQKALSRADAIGFLKEPGNNSPDRIVRINSPLTKPGQADIQALCDASDITGTVLIPKLEDPGMIADLQKRFKDAGVRLKPAVMIETIKGVETCSDIFSICPGLDFAMFGGADLAAELGTAVDVEPLAYGRSRLVYAARHAQVDVLDMPCLSFKDLEQVAQETAYARRLGFTGKAAIYPTNIDIINTAFTPTKQELAQAQRFVEAYQASTTGVAVVDGRLVEKPVVRSMELILARGRAAGLVS